MPHRLLPFSPNGIATSRRTVAALAIAAGLLAVGAGCSSGAGTGTALGPSSVTTDDPAPASGAAPSAGTSSAPAAGSAAGKNLVYVGPNFSTYQTIFCGAAAEAKRVGATLSKQVGTGFTAASQVRLLNAAVAARPDGVLISPTDPNGMYAPIKAAADRGIPVVAADNSLTNTAPLTWQSLVDNKGAGVTAADLIATQAAGRKGKVAVLSFTAGGSAAADDEWHAFETEIKKYSNLTYVGAQFDDGGVAQATQTASSMFARDPDLLGLFGTDGTADQGIMLAAQQRGLHPIIIAGYAAGEDSIVTGLRNGTVAAIVDFPFRQVGANGVDQLVNEMTGAPVDRAPTLPVVVYTKATMNEPGVVLGSAQTKC